MLERLSATLAVVAALAGAACSHTPSHAAAVAAAAQIAPWGLDLSARDPAVKPGDDFYRYAQGHWLDSQQIPPDRSRWGSFDELNERSHQQVRAIVEALPAGAPSGSAAQKVGDYYRSYLDTATIERLALAPAQPGLDAIAAARSYADVATLMGRPDLGLRSPLRIGMAPDQKDPDHYMVFLTQGGLGLPDRDYYLKDDAVYTKLRTQYVEHITRLLALSGTTDAATAGAGHPRARDTRREAALAGSQAARARPHLQPALGRAARAAGARLPLAGAVRCRRPRGAAALRGTRAGCGAGAGAAVHRRAARHLARLPALPLPGRALRPAAAGLRHRVLRVLRPHPARPAAAERALEARRRCARLRSGRGGRRAVRGALLPAELQAAGARSGREPARHLRGAHQAAAVDERRHQAGGAAEAGGVPSQDRLPRQVARLRAASAS